MIWRIPKYSLNVYGKLFYIINASSIFSKTKNKKVIEKFPSLGFPFEK